MESSCASDFIHQLQRLATTIGADSSIVNGSLTLDHCRGPELRYLFSGLHEAGYSVVKSTPKGHGAQLGVMCDSAVLPKFFSVDLRMPSIALPRSNGLVAAFLGPDGVGKTTAIQRVMAKLKPIFAEQHLFHWRPQILKPRTDASDLDTGGGWFSINRHGDPPRGRFISVMRLGGVYADYLTGHKRVIGPALGRGALVMFDRFYHDILVDSRRYRYGGPHWLLSLMKHFLPYRNVYFVVLDADERVILKRKREVGAEELRRQRCEYASLAHSLHCLHVRTDFGLEHTLAEILRGIGLHLKRCFDESLFRIEQKPSRAKVSVTVPNAA